MDTLYVRRQQKLFHELKAKNMERMLIGKPLNIFYLTGIMIKPYERFLALLVDAAREEYTMVVPIVEKGIAAGEGITELAVVDGEDPVEILAELLADTRSMGIEMAYFSMRLGSRLQWRMASITFTDCSGLIEEQRLIKDGDEVELIHQAALYGDWVLTTNRGMIREGVAEKELQFALLRSMSEKSGVSTDPFIIQVLAGERSANPHGSPGSGKFRKGDAVTIDFGVYYQHYWSDYTRTFFIGRPQPQLETIYRTVLEAQLAAIETVRPGIPIREVDQAARKIIEKAGFGPQFIHRTGHGLGLDIHESPEVSGANEQLLQEGMVFTVEPGIYLPGLGGVRIEDDVVVTAKGAMILNCYPKGFSDMVLD